MKNLLYALEIAIQREERALTDKRQIARFILEHALRYCRRAGMTPRDVSQCVSELS